MDILKELNEGLNHLIHEEIEEPNSTSTKYQPVEYGEEGKWAILDTEVGTEEKPTYVKRKASSNVMLFPNKQSANNYIRDYLSKEEE